MNIRTALSASGQMLITSMRLLVTRPYLLLYKVIPTAAPLVLAGVADYHRMFDLVLHYRPVMTSVTYALVGVQILCTVYLARRVMYLLYKKEPDIKFVGHIRLLSNTILWITLTIGGMYFFLRMVHWSQTTIKNPAIIKYAETSATLTAQATSLLMFVAATLILVWHLTLLVPPLLATKSITLPRAITRSLSIAWHNIMPYALLFFLFACLELVPTFVPLAIPRSYTYLKMITPYALQLLLTTLSTITYCVFYVRYKNSAE